MTYKRILIEEKEKQEILSRYGVISEQLDKTKGFYKTTRQQILKRRSSGEYVPKSFTIPAQTTIWPDLKNGKIIIGQATNDDNNTKVFNKLILGCDATEVIYDEKQYGYGSPFIDFIKKVFCVGQKLKTWEEITGVKKEVEKEVKKVVNKTIKLPDLTNKNYCSLAGDETWSYAKLDDGTWYASKNKVDWFKLDLPKYQKAIDLLNKDARCVGLEMIPVLKVKGLQPITPELTNTVQTNVAPDQDNEERPLTT
jgi:hypothetical protein